MNGVIDSQLAGALWLVVAAVLASRFTQRARHARRVLKGGKGVKPTREEAEAIRTSLMFEAVLGMGALLALFLILDALF